MTEKKTFGKKLNSGCKPLTFQIIKLQNMLIKEIKVFRVLQIALRGRENPPPPPSNREGGWDILQGGISLSGSGDLRRSDFDHSNLFQRKNKILLILNIY